MRIGGNSRVDSSQSFSRNILPVLDTTRSAPILGSLAMDSTLKTPFFANGTEWASLIQCQPDLPFPLGPFDTIVKSVDLTGKIVVVTGVSRGQGRAAAQLLKAAGAIVVGTSRHAAGYPTPGLFQKPAFIPQISPLLSNADVPQTCDYLLRMDLSFTAETSANGAQALTVAPFTLVVNGTTNFPAAGTLTVQTVANGLQNITYTGLTATSFTGCVAGGAYNIANGVAVYQEGSVQALSAVIHQMFATGPFVGQKLYALINNANRVFIGDGISSFTDQTAADNYLLGFKIGSYSAVNLAGLLFDLFPTNSDARIIFWISIGGYSPLNSSFLPSTYAAEFAKVQWVNVLTEQIGAYIEASPGSYTNFRICVICPDGVRTTLVYYPPIGDIGTLPGLNVNPAVALFSKFLIGTPAFLDDNQAGKTAVQLLSMLNPPIATFCTNDIFYNDYFGLTNSVNGFPPTRQINDTPTLQTFNKQENKTTLLTTTPDFLFVGFPAPWDVIPSSGVSYVNPFTGLPVVSSSVPFTVMASPLGDPTFDFQYNINGGPWLGAGTFTFGTPFAPLYTSIPVNLSSYSGQTITITVRIFTRNGVSVPPIPTGNAEQTDATMFFYKVTVQ
jgi:NAD(P)-dependent dehydrogenase (short-subunit alcohol dehydrogenase family)